MAESFSKISSMLARDLNIELESSAFSRLTDIPSAKRPQEISKLLNSRGDSDVLRGMRCVISLLSRGEDVSPYFADVVKNITSSVDKINVLVMFYLSRYANAEPETALLSINSIQKLLSLKNIRLRCLAIKTLSTIRIGSVVPILLLSVKKVTSDSSSAVRLAAAVAIGNAMEIEGIDKKKLFGLLSTLLGDPDTRVVETSIKIYFCVRDNVAKRWEPIHGNYRRFCHLLPEMDEWAQGLLIDLLTDYCRKFLPRPKLVFADQEIELPSDVATLPSNEYSVKYDADLQLLLDALRPLVHSTHEVVVLAVTRSLLALAPPKYIQLYNINRALVNYISANHPEQLIYNALIAIQAIIDIDTLVFQPFFRRFYLYSTDSVAVAKNKLEILSSLIVDNNAKYIIAELKHTSLSFPPDIAVHSIRALGTCSQLSPEWTRSVLKWALQQLHRMDTSLISELLTVARFLLQQKQVKGQDTNEITRAIYHLSLTLDQGIEWDAGAKSTVIWIIGEFTESTDNKIGADVLRRLLKNYSTEPAPVRYQILVLAAKLYSHIQDNPPEDAYAAKAITQMMQYVLQLAKYDDSYDSRDRARMFNVLLAPEHSNRELAALFFQVPKPMPKVGKAAEGNGIEPYFATEEWGDPASLPDAEVREPLPVLQPKVLAFSSATVPAAKSNLKSFHQPAGGISPVAKSNSYKLQSLDEFFADGSESSDTGESEDFDSSDSSNENEQVDSNISDEIAEDDPEA